MKVAIYSRVSTTSQTIENQVRVLEAVAAKMGATDITHFSDEGISGAKGRDQRKGLDDLLRAVTQRQLDKVLVFDISRLGRSLKDLINTMETIRESNVDFYCHQQALDTSTASGRALFGMLSIFSEWERETIRDRVVAGMERARANGVKIGRKSRVHLVAEQIAELREQGKTIRQIAEMVDVSTASVMRVIKNQSYSQA